MLLGIVPMLMTVGPASSDELLVTAGDCEDVTGDFLARAMGTIAETNGPMIVAVSGLNAQRKPPAMARAASTMCCQSTSNCCVSDMIHPKRSLNASARKPALRTSLVQCRLERTSHAQTAVRRTHAAGLLTPVRTAPITARVWTEG
jgi:hypothetical protein